MKKFTNENTNDNQIKECQIFLNEINALVENAKEIENKFFLSDDNNNNNHAKIKNTQININNLNEEKTNNLNNEKKLLEREYRGLKYILNCIEKNYNLNCNFNEELKISEKEQNVSEEASNEIYNLYITKNFNECYNLWEKYDFQMLIGFSPERSFDMLKYLNKIRDRYERRINILDSLNKLNLNLLKGENNHQSIIYSNINNSNSNYINNSQITNSDIYNLKLSENEQFTKKLRKQINNNKKIQNLNN